VSTKVWYCANCGYEVTARGRCFSCGARLVASPLPELESGPEDDEVGYRLEQWDDATRAGLIRELLRVGISHRFEDDELVVLAMDEPEVDRIVARVTGNTSGDEDEADEGVPVGNAGPSAEIYDAARRLRADPTDMQADGALSEASALLFASDYLVNLDDEQLAAVGRVTRRLLGALGADEALEDEIRHQAEVLCRLIAPSAGEEQTEMELGRARTRLEASAKSQGRAVTLPQSEVTPGGEMSAGPEGTEVPGAAPGPGVPPGEAVAAAGSPSGPGTASPSRETTAKVALEGGRRADDLHDEDDDDELDDDEAETGELVFELGEWLPEQRVELSLLLEAAGIAYNWDGPDLTVAEERETEVEALFSQVHGLADDDDEARYRAIEELFGSVDRLANDPDSEERRNAFMQTVGAVDLPTPVGVDDTYWWRVRTQGHALVAAVEQDRTDEVARDAALLAEMLHEMV
jgi:hypothetical protein